MSVTFDINAGAFAWDDWLPSATGIARARASATMSFAASINCSFGGPFSFSAVFSLIYFEKVIGENYVNELIV